MFRQHTPLLCVLAQEPLGFVFSFLRFLFAVVRYTSFMTYSGQSAAFSPSRAGRSA
jgi:hypothetical protein